MNKRFAFIASIAWAALTWRLTTTPNLVIAPENLLNTLIMMGGHFTFFGVQAVLIYLTLPSQLVAFTLTSLYGLSIELVQRHIPGRSADPLDLLLDMVGAIVFLGILKRLILGKWAA